MATVVGIDGGRGDITIAIAIAGNQDDIVIDGDGAVYPRLTAGRLRLHNHANGIFHGSDHGARMV